MGPFAASFAKARKQQALFRPPAVCSTSKLRDTAIVPCKDADCNFVVQGSSYAGVVRSERDCIPRWSAHEGSGKVLKQGERARHAIGRRLVFRVR